MRQSVHDLQRDRNGPGSGWDPKALGLGRVPAAPTPGAADGAENPGRLRHSQDASPHTTTRQKDRTRQPARSRTTRSQSPTRPLPEPASLGLALRLWSVSRPGLPHRHGRLPARMNETEVTPSGTDPHLLTNGGESRRVGAARARTRQPRARTRAKNRGVAPVHIPKAWMGTAAAPTGSQPQGSRRKAAVLLERPLGVHTPSVVVVRLSFGHATSRSMLKIPLHGEASTPGGSLAT